MRTVLGSNTYLTIYQGILIGSYCVYLACTLINLRFLRTLCIIELFSKQCFFRRNYILRFAFLSTKSLNTISCDTVWSNTCLLFKQHQFLHKMIIITISLKLICTFIFLNKTSISLCLAWLILLLINKWSFILF